MKKRLRNEQKETSAKWGYGSMKMDGIPAYCTLVFDLELVKIAQI